MLLTSRVRSSRPSRLELVAEGVWQVATEIRQPGGVMFPLNMTVIGLTGGLCLVSPVSIDDDLAAEIEALGEVREIVSPSCLHYLYLSSAQTRWPLARVLAPSGLASKLKVDAVLPEQPPERWQGQLEFVVVRGAPKLSETVFFHRASGTLICADLVFHVTRRVNLPTRLALWIGGTGGGRVAQSRAWRFFVRDHRQARADAERILAWPIVVIAFAHGEPLASPDARQQLARALAWMAAATNFTGAE